VQRENLRDTFGVLDEELNKLEWLANQNELASLDFASNHSSELVVRTQIAKSIVHQIKGQVVEELVSQRTVSAESLLRKVIHFCLTEARKQKLELALHVCAEGQISMTHAELIMAGMIPVVKASLVGLCSESVERRRKKHLFTAACLSLELRAEAGAIFFRAQDDGPGFKNGRSTRAIREYVSRYAGWCNFKSFANYGGRIDLRLPLQQGRVPCSILAFAGYSLAFPRSSLRIADARAQLRAVERTESGYCITYEKEQIPLFEFSENSGLRLLEEYNSTTEHQNLCILGVADFSIAILCTSLPINQDLKLVPGDEWLGEDSWFKTFGTYRNGNEEALLPFVDGTILMRLHKQYWG
jgi:hypothetical protein